MEKATVSTTSTSAPDVMTAVTPGPRPITVAYHGDSVVLCLFRIWEPGVAQEVTAEDAEILVRNPLFVMGE